MKGSFLPTPGVSVLTPPISLVDFLFLPSLTSFRCMAILFLIAYERPTPCGEGVGFGGGKIVCVIASLKASYMPGCARPRRWQLGNGTELSNYLTFEPEAGEFLRVSERVARQERRKDVRDP